ncbi:putative mucin/carbohydrate-binding domain-containing protein [Enterococcus rivorum]|uniref:putative mucin/carbohydrate-binding domain-containing protein n=1 Tax=Enterococcus rivorum TaxID=762845 RepID=UPI003641EB18
MTSKGLENIALPNNLEQELIKKIEAEGTELLQNERRKDISIQKSNVKKNLLLAIQSLPDPVNTQLIEKYAELFLSSKPQQGQAFEYTFKGVYDRVFATLIVSLNEGKGVIKTQGIQPHSYFNEKYASIIIQDQNGLNKYSKEYIGKSNYRASQEEVSIKVGDYITVYHTEFKNRLLIQNQGTRENLETKETITYQVTADGLALVETSDIPKPKPEDGRAFAYTFKGLSDRVFATMDVALNEGKAVIETKGGQPHLTLLMKSMRLLSFRIKRVPVNMLKNTLVAMPTKQAERKFQ